MILSHSKRFIFIHGPKVAGKSIKAALEPYNSRPYRLAPYLALPKYLGKKPKIFSGCFRGHSSALKLAQQLPESIFNEYFKFGFVRNPWDREVSRYFYILKTTDHPKHQKIKQMESFEEFAESLLTFHKEIRPLVNQIERLSDKSDNVLVDFIGKYENIHQDFQYACHQIGLPDLKLPTVNKSGHKNYRAYYSERSKAIIEQIYQKDIEYFQYQF